MSRPVVITGDLHFHKWTAFSSETPEGNSRLAAIQKNLFEIVSYCKQINSKTLILLGDIFHKRGVVDIESIVSFSTVLCKARSYGIEVKILVGNHDISRFHSPSLNRSVHALEPFRSWQGVTVYDRITVDYVDSHSSQTAMYIPYQEDHETIVSLLQSLGADGPDYVFGHFGVANAKIINSDFKIDKGIDLTKFRSSTVKKIFLGHYHTPQRLECSVPAYYVGSPLHHTFNDEGVAKSFAVLDLMTDTVRGVFTDYLEFKTVEAKSNEDLLHKVNCPGYYRVVAEDFSIDSEVAQKVADVVSPGGVEFLIKAKDSKKSDVSEQKFNVEAVVSSYIKTAKIKNKLAVYNNVTELLKNGS